MKVRGHCLVWDHNNPDWLAQGHFTTQQLSRLLHEHITRVMRHYAGQVFAWDVINEALDEKGNVRESLWYDQPGIGFSQQRTKYIEQVFRWAHKADPKALLFYNEAEGEALNRKSDAIYAMIKDFRNRGVPIHGVGLQMHVPMLDANIPAIAANITRLTALGVQVHFTELDVSLPVDSSGWVRTEDLTHQAGIYRASSEHDWTVLAARRSRPGDSLTSTHGLVLIRTALAARRCPSIEPISPRPPTARCGGKCWQGADRFISLLKAITAG
ncbi:MAG: endo-1,4-beta-xylanase [Candidatus Sulfotelmatobacter sp.]|jgi:endo-1,4-beta-xylanase